MTIKIVTDSACDLPPELAAQFDITVVPVYINVGENSFLEGVEITREQFYDQLPTYPVYPTTAAPAIGTFSNVYEQLTAAGATQILSIHIAHDLSSTYNAARIGATEANCAPVTLFDTRQITLGAGLLVLLAAEAVAAGQTVAQICAMLNQRVKRTRVFGMIDSLESLHRSGRVSWAQFGIGTLLQIKPIMLIADGVISAAAKVRTRKRAVNQMLKMVAELAPFERLAIIHVNARTTAAKEVATGEITRATRSVTLDGVEVHEGEYIGLVDGRLCTSNSDLTVVLNTVLTAMEMEERELLSIYYGQDISQEKAAALANQIEAQYDEVEIELLPGKQPYYFYILGAE